MRKIHFILGILLALIIGIIVGVYVNRNTKFNDSVKVGVISMISDTNNSNNYIHENVECQKMLNEFENKYPEKRQEGYEQSDYNIFYSPVRESCMGTYNNYAFETDWADSCFYIVDLFDPVYVEKFCRKQNYDYNHEYYSESTREIGGKYQYPFYINGHYEGEGLKEDRIQYLKGNIKESEINYRKYAHPKSYNHALITNAD